MPFKRTGPETTAIPTEPRVMKEDGKYVYRSPSESPNADLIYRTPLHNPLRRSDTESEWPVENPFLVELLEKADWSFQMSDSHTVYERGREELYLLKHHAAEHAKQSTEHAEWVSRAWNTARRNASSEVFEGYQPPAIEVLARVRVTGTTLAIDDSPGDHDFSQQSRLYDKTFEIPATAFLDALPDDIDLGDIHLDTAAEGQAVAEAFYGEERQLLQLVTRLADAPDFNAIARGNPDLRYEAVIINAGEVELHHVSLLMQEEEVRAEAPQPPISSPSP